MCRYLPTFKILCGAVSVSSLNTALIYNHLYNPSNKASLENAMIRSNAIIPRFLMNSTLSSSALLLQKWNRKRCISTWKKLYYYCNYYTFLKSKCFLKSIFYFFSKIGTKSNFPTPIEFSMLVWFWNLFYFLITYYELHPLPTASIFSKMKKKLLWNAGFFLCV